MQIPTIFYGINKDVKRRVRSLAKKVAKGANIYELIAQDYIDTKNHKGLIVLKGPDPGLGNQAHFHIYWFFRLLSDNFDLLNNQKAFELAQACDAQNIDLCLESAWGTLAVACPHFPYLPKSKHAVFLDSILKHWATYKKEGKRFAGSTVDIMHFSGASTKLGWVLGQWGTTNEELRLIKGQDEKVLSLIREIRAKIALEMGG